MGGASGLMKYGGLMKASIPPPGSILPGPYPAAAGQDWGIVDTLAVILSHRGSRVESDGKRLPVIPRYHLTVRLKGILH